MFRDKDKLKERRAWVAKQYAKLSKTMRHDKAVKKIANKLFLSPYTIENDLQNS